MRQHSAIPHGVPTAEDFNGSVFRRRLGEHLAGIEAAADRAALALDLGDAQALDQAVTALVRGARLAEDACVRLQHYEGIFGPVGRRA